MKKTFLEKLKDNYPQLVEEYSEMSKEQLLEQICAEVIDLHNMNDRVQLFMNECTNGLSKTTYTIEAINGMITEKQEMDINEFCADLIEMDRDSIMADISDRANQIEI